MTLASLYSDFLVMGVFLIIGFLVREIIKPLQKLFLPASIIGGVIALIMGQQVMGLVEIPKSFGGMSGILINVVMTGLVFGVTLNKRKIVSMFDYSVTCQGLYGMQMCLGVGLGALLSTMWTGLPQGWGVMGLFSFHGGHGTAGAAGAVFQELGIPDNLTMGMLLSTFGLITAMTVGMVMVNYGVRKGWATFVREPQKQPPEFYGGALSEGARKPIGVTVTTGISINAVALQFGWLLLAAFLGKYLFKGIGYLGLETIHKLPTLVQGIVGAVILWPILCKLGLDKFTCKRTVSQISGLCLEIVVLTAMATLNLKFIVANIAPILIYTVICVTCTLCYAFYFTRKFCTDQWFEKGLMIFGMGTGNTATGLALVRAVDPNSESNAGDCHGVYSAWSWVNNFFVALTPVWLMTGVTLTMGIGFAIFAACLIIGYTVCAPAKRRAMQGKL